MSARPVVDGAAASAAVPEEFKGVGGWDVSSAGHNAEFDDILGKVPRAAFIFDEALVLVFEDEAYAVVHVRDCCERVNLIDVCGDPSSLVGRPILVAESVAKSGLPENGDECPFEVSDDDYPESWTWQFVKIGNDLETLTVQFRGTSNGYYNETAELRRLERTS